MRREWKRSGMVLPYSLTMKVLAGGYLSYAGVGPVPPPVSPLCPVPESPTPSPSAPTSLLRSLLSVLLCHARREHSRCEHPLGTPWGCPLGPEALSALETALGPP